MHFAHLGMQESGLQDYRRSHRSWKTSYIINMFWYSQLDVSCEELFKPTFVYLFGFFKCKHGLWHLSTHWCVPSFIHNLPSSFTDLKILLPVFKHSYYLTILNLKCLSYNRLWFCRFAQHEFYLRWKICSSVLTYFSRFSQLINFLNPLTVDLPMCHVPTKAQRNLCARSWTELLFPFLGSAGLASTRLALAARPQTFVLHIQRSAVGGRPLRGSRSVYLHSGGCPGFNGVAQPRSQLPHGQHKHRAQPARPPSGPEPAFFPGLAQHSKLISVKSYLLQWSSWMNSTCALWVHFIPVK